MSPSGKVVGGAGGLGRVCALDLAGAGVDLAIVDRDAAAIAGLESMLASHDVRVRTANFAARDLDCQASFFAGVDAEYNGIDVLLNVVGGTFGQSFEASTPKGWEVLIRTNFTSIMAAIQQAIPLVRKRGSGSIINLTSIEAHRAAPGHAVYSSLKAAVTNLRRTLAVELGPDQIPVNNVAPDLVPTPNMVRSMPASLWATASVQRSTTGSRSRWHGEGTSRT